MRHIRLLQFLVLLFMLAFGAAAAEGVKPGSADAAFQLTVGPEAPARIVLTWSIAPGHYLYRDKIAATVNDKAIMIATEPGEPKEDPNFGQVEIYRARAQAFLATDSLPSKATVFVTYQGCAENKLCYPPITKTLDLDTLVVGGNPQRQAAEVTPGLPSVTSLPSADGLGSESAALNAGFGYTLLAFFGFGILLSLTPCVFPMIPILSGILTQSGKTLSTGRSFALSGTYIVAMAAAFALLGVFAAWSGENLQALLQTPLVVLCMAAVFVMLAMSMLGLFDLQLPSGWTARWSAMLPRGGSFGSALVLGFVSTLIVGPCVTPPLAAALLYVAQTGDVLRGASALFAFGLGSGLPLLIVGVVGAKALPRAGQWLENAKHAFGFVFLGLAIWMASRVVPLHIVVMAWGGLAIGMGLYLSPNLLSRNGWRFPPLARDIAGGAAVAYGLIMAVAAAAMFYGPAAPLMSMGLVPEQTKIQSGGFIRVATVEELDAVMSQARRSGRPLFVDFSAEWCTECKVMERSIFSAPAVREKLAGMILVQADLSHFNEASRRLMKRFAVIGPPTLLFLDAHGRELENTRIVGATSVDGFLFKLAEASGS